MKTLLVITICTAFLSTNCLAQRADRKDKKDKKAEVEQTTEIAEEDVVEEVEAVPEITEECLINISLFNESAKNKQFADAVEPWLAAFEECPNGNKVIYSQGRNILHWQLSQTTDPAERDTLRKRLMKMYDQRIKYFGDDPKYPTSWILGLKALDYITYFPEDSLKENAYQWLEKSINGMKAESEVGVLQQFVVLSSNIYKVRPEHGEKFINDYLKATEYLDVIAKDETNRYAEMAGQIKIGLDALFVQSGAADCGILDNIYKDEVANSSDLEFLNRIIAFYKRTGCTKSEIYFAASEKAHKISPSSESANGCAEMAYLRNDFTQAIAYYEESIQLSTDDMEKAEQHFKIAQVYGNDLKNFSAARSHARKSLEYNPDQGKPYLLIGMLYAQSKPYDNPVLNKTVFWVAVDEFRKAKQVDPSCEEDANQMIATYSRYFPTTEEIFFQPELQDGQPFTVGGWIGQSTICR